MAEFDHGFKIIARESGQALARVAGYECRTWEPGESTLQATTERLADRVFIAGRGRERFVVYFEFVTTWDRSVPWSVLGKSGMLAERERLPVACVVFILRRQGYAAQHGTMQLTIGGRPAQQVWFSEKPLWEVVPEPWWETEPGLMALYPLCGHSERPKESILHAAARIEENEPDAAIRADLLTSLGIFGRLAFPRLDALTLIGREKMKESKAYQEILEEGRQDGERRAIMLLVERRFGKAAAAGLRRSLDAVEDRGQLDRLLVLASSCERLEDFRAALVSP